MKGRVAIYARYSSDQQRESSIDDQVRVCRDHIKRAGGNPDSAEIFADYAVSGRSTAMRPGFETMMEAVAEKRIDAIVTEDISRISRDFADSAQVFKLLQFARVPLVSVSDGIDTSTKGAKMSFTLKSLVADIYIDDLKDKTKRGLDGRAHAGQSTGGLPFGYRSKPVLGRDGKPTGFDIEIDPDRASIILRIFRQYLDGVTQREIAHRLNQEGVPSPRTGSRHTAMGWGQTTTRSMLRNSKYAGIWTFNEREWTKDPTTGKRRPRKRTEGIITKSRPELAIVDKDTWDAAQARIDQVAKKYGKRTRGNEGKRVTDGRLTTFPLSGILKCGDCGTVMTISSGTSASYYRCANNRTKGVCPNSMSVREDVARVAIFDALRDRLTKRGGIDVVRKQLVKRIAEAHRERNKELLDRGKRLARIEEKIRGLIDFISDGDRSEYIVQTLRDQEAHAKDEKRAIASLERLAGEPIALPSPDQVIKYVSDLGTLAKNNPTAAREALGRLFADGEIRLHAEGGVFVAKGKLLPMVILSDAENVNAESRSKDSALFKEGSGGPIRSLNNAIPIDFSARLARAA